MSVAPPLNCDLKPTPTGPKALLFAYKLYLLPTGDMQSAVENIDPETVRNVTGELLDEETGHIISSTIKFLLETSIELDEKLEAHLQAL